VAVGENYYINKTKGIEKRSSKSKRGETSLNQESTKRYIERRVVPYHKDNAIQIVSTLNAFVGENAMFLYPLVSALDTSQTIVVELEEALRIQRNKIIVEFKEEVGATEKFHIEEMEKVL